MKHWSYGKSLPAFAANLEMDIFTRQSLADQVQVAVCYLSCNEMNKGDKGRQTLGLSADDPMVNKCDQSLPEAKSSKCKSLCAFCTALCTCIAKLCRSYFMQHAMPLYSNDEKSCYRNHVHRNPCAICFTSSTSLEMEAGEWKLLNMLYAEPITLSGVSSQNSCLVLDIKMDSKYIQSNPKQNRNPKI